MSGKTENYSESTPGATPTNSSNNVFAAFKNDGSSSSNSNTNSNSSNNNRETELNPFLLVPQMHDADHVSPSNGGIRHRYDPVRMDRIARAWISSAPTTAVVSAEIESQSQNEGTQRGPEEFQDELSESLDDPNNRTNNRGAVRNSFEGLRKSLFPSNSSGVWQQQQEQEQYLQEEEDGLRLCGRGDIDEGDHITGEDNHHDSWLALDLQNDLGIGETSMPSTPTSIADDLMDLSFHKSGGNIRSSDDEDCRPLPVGRSYGQGPEISRHNEKDSNDDGCNNENDNEYPNHSDANGCNSFKAVASPEDVQESAFSWMMDPPQSGVPDKIFLDDNKGASVDDELLTGDGDSKSNREEQQYNNSNNQASRLRLFQPKRSLSRPVALRKDDRQMTPNSWHTPISMRPSAAYRNTSGGSRRTRGSNVPLSPSSRRSGSKSEKFYHSYETNTSSPPKPVPPFVVVHSGGSAVVKVTPKKTTILPEVGRNKRRKPTKADSFDAFIPEETNQRKASCGCDGSANTSSNSWCKKLGRSVTIALTAAVFVLAVVTVIASLVKGKQIKEQKQQPLWPQNPETIDTLRPNQPRTESPVVLPPTSFSTSKPEGNPDFDGIKNDLVLEANATGNLDTLWEGIELRPYEETRNPALVRPTLAPRTYPPSIAPYREEVTIPTTAPTLLPDSFPDFVPTDLPYFISQTQEPPEPNQEDDTDVEITPLQIPWNNYVIGLLSVESPHTFSHFDDPMSPQFLALQWISVDSARKGGSIAYNMDASLQRFALATVYFALGGIDASWSRENSWLSTVVNVCEWYGIQCDESNTAVLSLDLAKNGLAGTLPEELILLKYLQTLRFSGNSIGGTLPPEYSILNELVEFNLSGNFLSGTLPWEYGGAGSFEKLKILELGNNQLQGDIPSELGGMTSLESINICHNVITGTIPSALGAMSGLKSLRLGNNLLSGDLPGAFCDETSQGGPLPDLLLDCEVGCDCCTLCCGDDDDKGDSCC